MAKKQQKRKNDPKPFDWEGKNKSGQLIKGRMDGINAQEIKTRLRNQGVEPKKVAEAKVKKKKGGKITPADIAIFSRQLATMLKNGVPLVSALDIVRDGSSTETMKELISQIKEDVSSGTTFTESLSKHPAYFDELFVNLISTGEESGNLEQILDSIATYKEKGEAVKAKIKKATNYPKGVLAIATIVSMVLLIKVVPTFQTMFESFGGQLPSFTQMVVDMSDYMQANWLKILGGGAALIFGLKQYLKKSAKAQEFIEYKLVEFPITRDIVTKSAVARFARTLATTFASGVPLVDGLEAASGAAGNLKYKRGILAIKEQVETGQSLYFSMEVSGLFEKLIVQMVQIGEESGSIDKMLEKSAEYYEAEVDNAVDGLTSMLEPMIMAFLAVVIGGLIIAMYLPIFKMGGAA